MPAESPEWSYTGNTGPPHWGSLDPAYETCSVGREQSPIDLRDGEPAPPEEIAFSYRPSALGLSDNGHSLEATVAPGNTIAIAGTTYKLLQFHHHAPGEHHLRGTSFPLELHFVHQADDGALAVLGVFVREGGENPAYEPILLTVPSEAGGTVEVGVVDDPLTLLPANPSEARRWSYDGSLTTPPCSEGVLWNVFDEPIEMSAAQITSFASVHSGTNRPLQPLNGRQLRLVG